jgi:hypothetical protein
VCARINIEFHHQAQEDEHRTCQEGTQRYFERHRRVESLRYLRNPKLRRRSDNNCGIELQGGDLDHWIPRPDTQRSVHRRRTDLSR